MMASVFGLVLGRRPRHIQAMDKCHLDLALDPFGSSLRVGATLLAAVVILSACQPTVRLEAPQEPIVINLNVKIEQEVRIRVERELEDVIRANQALF
jgi:hypothetical protein